MAMKCLVGVVTERSSEDDSGVMSLAPSSMVKREQWRWKSEHGARKSEAEAKRVGARVERELGRPLWWPGTHGSNAYGGRGCSSCAVAMRGTHVVHCGIQPNMWLVEWPTWDTVLGLLWVNLDFGPLIKIVAHMMIYKFD
jgi:hypothetical protein